MQSPTFRDICVANDFYKSLGQSETQQALTSHAHVLSNFAVRATNVCCTGWTCKTLENVQTRAKSFAVQCGLDAKFAPKFVPQASLQLHIHGSGIESTKGTAVELEYQYLVGTISLGNPMKLFTKVSKDFETMSAEEIVEKYGMYYTTELALGGSAKQWISSATEGTETELTKALQQELMSESSSLCTLQCDFSFHKDITGKFCGKEAKLTRFVVGGLPEKFNFNKHVEPQIQGGKDTDAEKDEWIASVKESPAIISSKYRSIADLMPSQNKKKEVEVEINKRLSLSAPALCPEGQSLGYGPLFCELAKEEKCEHEIKVVLRHDDRRPAHVLWKVCGASQCKYYNKWMHEDCWDRFHALANAKDHHSYLTKKPALEGFEYVEPAEDLKKQLFARVFGTLGSVPSPIAWALGQIAKANSQVALETMASRGAQLSADAVAAASKSTSFALTKTVCASVGVAVTAIVMVAEISYTLHQWHTGKITTKMMIDEISGSALSAVCTLGATAGGAAAGFAIAGPVGLIIGGILGAVCGSVFGYFGGKGFANLVAGGQGLDEDDELRAYAVCVSMAELGMKAFDPFEKNFTKVEVERSFRHLSRQWHPDKARADCTDEEKQARVEQFCRLSNQAASLVIWVESRDELKTEFNKTEGRWETFCNRVRTFQKYVNRQEVPERVKNAVEQMQKQQQEKNQAQRALGSA